MRWLSVLCLMAVTMGRFLSPERFKGVENWHSTVVVLFLAVIFALYAIHDEMRKDK